MSGVNILIEAIWYINTSVWQIKFKEKALLIGIKNIFDGNGVSAK